uniref:Uncharacterized protein n=1 Tax=Cannabis sativa TaxID=3483 RepID=A0A803QS76_CANSA
MTVAGVRNKPLEMVPLRYLSDLLQASQCDTVGALRNWLSSLMRKATSGTGFSEDIYGVPGIGSKGCAIGKDVPILWAAWSDPKPVGGLVELVELLLAKCRTPPNLALPKATLACILIAIESLKHQISIINKGTRNSQRVSNGLNLLNEFRDGQTAIMNMIRSTIKKSCGRRNIGEQVLIKIMSYHSLGASVAGAMAGD